MTEEEYLHLYEKYLNGTCTPKEEESLKNYQDNFRLNDRPWMKEMGEKEQVKAAIYTRLQQAMRQKEKRVFSLWKVAAAAAVLILVAGGITYLVRPDHGPASLKQESRQQVPPKPVNDVLPGNDKALLKLSDGSVVTLDQTAAGVIAGEKAVQIVNEDGQLSYRQLYNNMRVQTSAFNTISTPRGGQYRLELSDGTRVWLNATSSLQFPAVFEGGSREVELSGEAYFEVAKASFTSGRDVGKRIPFIVRTAGLKVDVLGTHFNLNSYGDEPGEKVTLLEGSVRVSNGRIEKMLVPGQQATVSAAIAVKNVNVEEETAWKNGLFQFDNHSLKHIMRQLERWYDVQIDYSTLPDTHYSGMIPRKARLSEVLRMLEVTGGIRFRIEGKKIYITQP